VSDDDEVNTSRSGSSRLTHTQHAATDLGAGDIVAQNGVHSSARSGTDGCQNITAILAARSNGAETTQSGETTLVLAGVSASSVVVRVVICCQFRTRSATADRKCTSNMALSHGAKGNFSLKLFRRGSRV